MMENRQIQQDEEAAAVDQSEAMYSAVMADDVASLQRLLSEGVSPDLYYNDEHNISSKYILHIACGRGHSQCVQALLEAGATPDSHDSWGQTPFHYCVSMQFLACARAFLCHRRLGPDASHIVNNQDCFGKSCLHAAAEQGQGETILFLLEHGADVDTRNFDGVTPLMTCAEACGKPRALASSMRALVEAGALIDLVDYRVKRTALQRAALARNLEGVEMLLSAGAEVDALDVTRRTALTNLMWEHVRYRQGACHIDADVMTAIVLLTQGGADLNLAVCEYSNPLVTASFLQAAPLVHFFLDQGADPNVTFSSGVTPLLVATSKKDEDCVKLLLRHNPCLTTKGRIFRRRQDVELTCDPVEMALDDRGYRMVQTYLAAGYNACSIRTRLLEKLAADKDDVDAELYQWLMDRVSGPPKLRELVIYSLRGLLGQRLHRAVPSLPLPSKIKDSILLKGLLKVDCVSGD